MPKTKYIKVAVADRLPEPKKDVIFIYDCDQIATGFISENGYYWIYDAECHIPEYWLDEVPDHEAELVEMLEEIRNGVETRCDYVVPDATFDKLESLLQNI